MRAAALAEAAVIGVYLGLRPVSTNLYRLPLGLRGQLVVLVDESAEHVAAGDLAEGRRNGGVPRHRRLEAEAPADLEHAVKDYVTNARLGVAA